MGQIVAFFSSSEELKALFWWLGVVSFFTFFLSLLLIPWIVGMLSQDCFIKLGSKEKHPRPLSLLSLLITLLRHILGGLLILAGICMLFLPGQGLLTIILGGLMISFPGKERLINQLVAQPKMQRSMDWLRMKRGKTAFDWPVSREKVPRK